MFNQDNAARLPVLEGPFLRSGRPSGHSNIVFDGFVQNACRCDKSAIHLAEFSLQACDLGVKKPKKTCFH